MTSVMAEVAGIRRMGAAALDLAYVAAGRYDGFWEANLSPWDIAAGIVIVREAGGLVTDLAGGEKMLETGGIIAANDAMHTPLRSEEHTSELQSLMRISYAVFCLKKKKQ